jgi:hypothetical protein
MSTNCVLIVVCKSPVEGATCKKISVFVFRLQFVGLKMAGDPGSKTLCFSNLDYGKCPQLWSNLLAVIIWHLNFEILSLSERVKCCEDYLRL